MFGGSMKLDHQRFSALFVLLICALVSVNNSYAQQMVQQPELVKVMPSGVKGSPTDVLAELSDIKITRDMYDKEVEAFKQVAQPQATAQLITPEGRQDFLRQLVEVTMFQKKAQLENLDKTDAFKTEVHNAATVVLSMEHMRRLLDKITVDEAATKKFYEENKKSFTEPDQYHLFQITTDSKDKADAIVKDINGGKSFIEIAKASSLDESKSNGGDKGFINIDEIAPEIGAAVSSLEKDKISAPIKIDEDLFVIVKYTEKKTGEIKPFDTVSSQIRRDIAGEKQIEVFKGEIERLKKAYNFSLDMKVAETLRKDKLTDDELNAIVAKYDGKDIKISEIHKDLEQIPTIIRPQILGGEGLNDFLDQHFARVLSLVDAEKNFDAYSKENPGVIADVTRRTLVKSLFDKILNPVTVSDAEIKEFYNKNLSNFVSPARFQAHHILVKEEAEAKKIMETLTKEPAKFEEIAKTSSTCPSGGQGGDLGTFSEGQMVPEFENACKTAELKKVVGPVKTQFGYHIIRVDSRTSAETMKFEDVQDNIRKQLLPQKQKEVFDAYVETLRKEFNVKVYQDNL
jgi:peptidyl-prolyl cis-trans isomerase C